MATTQNAVNGRSGTVINKVRTTSNTIFTGSYPSITKGTVLTTSNTIFLCSLTIAPESSSNVLVFNCTIPLCTGTGGSSGGVGIALFQGSTLLTSTWSSFTGLYLNCSLLYQQAAGTTSSTTYYIYIGPLNTTGLTGNTIYINEDYSGNTYNNSLNWTFTITEEIA